MIKLLHFADAHIDMANYGRHDPISGLPLRVLDFLKSLDTIIDAAIDEKVDLVVFSGDAYKDRSPAPTFQREWGKRIIRLSQAGIQTLLLVGNHDISPSTGRASSLQEFDTLDVPNVHVIAKPAYLTPADLGGLPLQVLALPWIYRSNVQAVFNLSNADPKKVDEQIELELTQFIQEWLDQADPNLPRLMIAHASIEGAQLGSERMVSLGGDFILPGSLVKDPRLDYVALGHIHKAQNLNKDSYPPVIYPGSIERVDFGEAADDKYYVIVRLSRGKTEFEWRKLTGIRPFIDRKLTLSSNQEVTTQLVDALEPLDQLKDAIVRLVVTYPHAWDAQIDEPALLKATAEAFEFQLVRRPQIDARARLSPDEAIASKSAMQLLDLYLHTSKDLAADAEALEGLAKEILQNPENA